MSDQNPFPTLGLDILNDVEAALLRLRSIGPDEAARPLAPGKWSPKQIIGHLIDSAANNHQRFVRGQLESGFTFPGYAQDQWVACQHYEDHTWDDIVAFWHSYNRHLAHIIARMPADQHNVACTIGSNPPTTLGFLADDYRVHLRHHLAQLDAIE